MPVSQADMVTQVQTGRPYLGDRLAVPARRTRHLIAHCPRCHGRLFFHEDLHGAYLSCMTCGCVLEERSEQDAQTSALSPAVWWRAQSA